MTIDSRIRDVVQRMMELLAAGRYEEVERWTQGNRVPAGDMERTVNEYPATFLSPPRSAYSEEEGMLIDEVENASDPTYMIDMPFWSREEGRSDLEVRLTVVLRADGTFNVSLDDILVP